MENLEARTEGSAVSPRDTPPKDGWLSQFSLRMTLGFGLHWAWVYATIYATRHIFFYSTDSTVNPLLFPLLSMASLVATLLFYGIQGGKAHYIKNPSFQLKAGIFMIAGTFCLLLAGALPTAEIYFTLPAGLLTGFGSGTLLICWGEGFRRRDAAAITLNTATSIVIAYSVYALLLFPLPHGIGPFLVCLLPVAETFFLLKTLHGKRNPEQIPLKKALSADNPGLGPYEIPTFHDLKVKRSFFAVRIGIPSLVFGFALGLLRHLYFGSTSEPFEFGSQLIFIVGAVLGSVLFIISMIAVSSRDYDDIYRILVPVIAISLFVVPAINELSTLLGLILLLMSVICFELMMWVAFCEISHRYRISPLLVFGFGRGFLTLGTMIGVVSTVVVPADFALLQANLGLSFLIVMLLIGYILLPREQDIKNLVIIDYGEQLHAPSSIEGTAQTAGAGTDTSETTGKTDSPSRFAMRCQRVADTYLLSARETEILFLLAKGRNAAFIQKELYISEGTARTHMWRIYKKLNIHTQQELMDLIDSER